MPATEPVPATALFRLARSAAFAAVALGLSVGAHAFAGGTVTVRGAAAGLALAFAAALPATGRERGLGMILPLLTGVQATLHLMFAATAPVAAVDSMAGMAGHSGLVPGLAMLVTHGWAIGLTALWLARGEALLWAVLRRLGARFTPVLAGEPSPVPGKPSGTPRRDGPAAPRRSPLRHVVSRRGPPVPATFLL
ncbi:MFS transporter [Streptosporangium sandarakinum]|uniref:MFS transporter n=1 Tax=Streptosporangium sandarakinum TaxID=1260955 RepID=UPI00371C92A0